MKTSPNGFALIEKFEGFSHFAYRDIAGNWTIGFGHKLLPGESFPQGITQDAALALLQKDVQVAESAVNRLAPQANQNQFDALVDFAYECGTGALQMMLGHGWDHAPEQMPRWNHAAGKVSDGLTRRRAAELELFNTPI